MVTLLNSCPKENTKQREREREKRKEKATPKPKQASPTESPADILPSSFTMANAMNRSDKSEQRMNLGALQRVDPFIAAIVASAKQVAVYKYVQEEWEQTDINGTLFVCERSQGCQPRHGFVVLNRLSARNLVEPVTRELNFQLQAPFLLYKTKEDDIYGIWFYDKKECENVSNIIQELVAKTDDRAGEPEAPSADLGAMLMKAAGSGGGGGSQEPKKKGQKKPQQ